MLRQTENPRELSGLVDSREEERAMSEYDSVGWQERPAADRHLAGDDD